MYHNAKLCRSDEIFMNQNITFIGQQSEISLTIWIMRTFYGWMLGVVLVLFISSLLEKVGIGYLQFYVGVAMSTGVALMQWGQLKKIINVSSGWIALAAVSMGLPFFCVDILMPMHTSYKLIIASLFGTVVLSSCQMMQLKKFFADSHFWFIGTTIGWVLSSLVLLFIEFTMKYKGAGWVNLGIAILNIIIILSGGFILGFFSGRAIQKMISKPTSI